MQEEFDIHENFPTYVQEDYGEFMEESVSKILPANKKESNKMGEHSSIIKDTEYKFITDTFIHLMLNFTNVYYKQNIVKCNESIDYVTLIKERTSIFSKIYMKFKSSLNEEIDEAAYNSLVLLFGTEVANFNKDSLMVSYNYYKDPNTNELQSCTDILNAIESKVITELELYPDHATLNDVSSNSIFFYLF